MPFCVLFVSVDEDESEFVEERSSFGRGDDFLFEFLK